MKKRFLFLVVITVSLLFRSPSYGLDITGLQPGSPYGAFSAFSAESLPKGKIAVTPAAEISKEPDFYKFTLKSAYGITDSVEFNATLPYINKWNNKTSGIEDFAFGIKHRVFNEGKFEPSVAYILNASLASGREEFSTDGRFGAGIVVSKRVGPVNGHANILYEKAGDKKLEDELIVIPGLDFSAGHNFKLLAELYMKKSHYSTDFDLIEARVGYRVRTTDMIYTTFGAGFDLKNRRPEYRILFSVTFASPSEKKEIKKVYEEE
jgi:hypothetical protein